MKLIYIEWCDAIYNARWFHEDEVKQWAENSDFTIKEVGWVIEETDKYIVLGCGKKEADENTDVQYLGVHKIPKGWVKKRKIIKIKL